MRAAAETQLLLTATIHHVAYTRVTPFTASAADTRINLMKGSRKDINSNLIVLIKTSATSVFSASDLRLCANTQHDTQYSNLKRNLFKKDQKLS